MKDLISNNPNDTPFSMPQTLIRVGICPYTGTLSCDGCPTRYEYFAKGKEPKTKCDSDEVKRIIEQRNAANNNQILDGTATGTN